MSELQQRPTMLLVAGSANSARLMSKPLHDFFTVLFAEDAESAWDSIIENREIVLLLGELELMIDQFGLLERIRSASDSWLAATPVLLLVGEDDSENGREHAFQMGATDFINLPFASSELTARARLHANLYLQHAMESPVEMQPVSAANMLQQLSQENFFNARAQQEFSFSQRHRSNISLCKLKLDNIKTIIAQFDKATAIAVVKMLAGTIQQTLRREDTLCYLGNAEFYLLYPATNGIGATTGVNRIFKNISGTKIRIAGKQVPVTLSAAVHSCIATENFDLDHIYQRLESGLKRAQSAGGNQVISTSATGQERNLSIDRALKLIEADATDEVSKQVVSLVLNLLPLLEFADQSLRLGLDKSNRDLRRQLESISKAD